MRKVKNIIDKTTGEAVYAMGHAQATYMSDGRTVEDAIVEAMQSGGGSSDIYIFVRSGDSGVLSADEVAKLFAAKYVIVRDSGVVKNICASVITGESDVSFTYVSISIQAEMFYCQKVSITVGSDGVWSSVQSDYSVMQADWEAEEGASAILNKPENLFVAEATDEEVEEAEGVPNVKYVAQSLTAEQQKQARENIGGAEATPSGDPMHYAYMSAGAVWNGESWQADQRKDLTNEQVRKLFIKEDMSEMLFRKMWNMAGVNVKTRCKYNETTGFYEANGVWHMTYDDALLVYATSYYMRPSYRSYYSRRRDILGITTMPSISSHSNMGFPHIFWPYNIVDISFGIGGDDECWYNHRSPEPPMIGYAPNLRVIRDIINLYGISSYKPLQDRITSLVHIRFVLSSNSNITTNISTCERLGYLSLYYTLAQRDSTNTHTLKLHPTVYGFVTGTINPEELSKEPMRPENADYDLIPYQQNLKVIPDNAFWREELDVKGINGEYVYPSFAEYLTNNPSNFATAEEWQALATLAQEKNVTLVQ